MSTPGRHTSGGRRALGGPSPVSRRRLPSWLRDGPDPVSTSPVHSWLRTDRNPVSGRRLPSWLGTDHNGVSRRSLPSWPRTGRNRVSRGGLSSWLHRGGRAHHPFEDRSTLAYRSRTGPGAVAPRGWDPGGSGAALDDSGAVGGAEVLPLAVLTFVVGCLMTANLWAVVDARFAVDGAAREAARRYVEAPDEATARAEAYSAAAEAIAGQGRDPARMQVVIDHPDGRGWAACVPTAVTVRYPVDVRGLPGLGDDRLVTVEATHHQVVDPWRSGLPQQEGCR